MFAGFLLRLGFIDCQFAARSSDSQTTVTKKRSHAVLFDRHQRSSSIRYPPRQIIAVVLVTFGIILATYASGQTMYKQKVKDSDAPPDYLRWTMGTTFKNERSNMHRSS